MIRRNENTYFLNILSSGFLIYNNTIDEIVINKSILGIRIGELLFLNSNDPPVFICFGNLSFLIVSLFANHCSDIISLIS